jgi:succinyl-CoA synthetase beta subunit
MASTRSPRPSSRPAEAHLPAPAELDDCPATFRVAKSRPYPMNIHEYQAKELLDSFGVANSPGGVASTPEEAEKIARSLGTNNLVVKAQIHAGGRGKGTFTTGYKGGVQLCKTSSQIREAAAAMLGNTLVTHQTGPEGRLVRKVLVAESVEVAHEFYFAILIDRAISAPVVVASTEGGVDIESVAEKTPDKIIRMPVDPRFGLQPFQTRKLAKLLGLGSTSMRPACKLFANLYRLFIARDCSMVEINPLVLTKGGEVLALDAKFNFDDNALFRHPDIQAYRDTAEEDPREVEASKFNLSYIGLDGNIACLVNGAGLAMATMDIIKHHGGEPANFLDVGGGASEQQVTEAFKILVSDKKVKAILVNIFGGIMKCDVIAQGIINAVKAVDLPVPLVVRLEGTNVEDGRRLLAESGLELTTATDIADAASKAVAAAA